MSDQEYQRFEELLPFYVNGTLDQPDRQFVEQYLAQHGYAQQSLNFTSALHKVVQGIGQHRAADQGLEKLLHEYRLLHPKQSWLDKFQAICKAWGFTPAFAVAATVIAIQTGILLSQQPLPTDTEYRSMPSQVAATPNLKVIVSPKASFADLSALLQQHGCHIVSGPSETGELWLKLDKPEDASKIQKYLLDSGLVDDATVIK